MSFTKYLHVEKLGTSETQNIENGMCYIFPKIDGTNASIWIESDGLHCGSRNRELSLDNDNAGFMEWAIKQENIIKLLSSNPHLTLYGEWLVPHTLETYEQSAWRKFYVFDVYDNITNDFLNYEIYKSMLDYHNIDYIPAICKIQNPSYEKLVGLLEKNTFLIEDGKGTGEGIVIKNYDYTNRFGRYACAKLVKNDFKTKHAKVNDVLELQEKQSIEDQIVNLCVTKALVDKEYSKIELEKNGWSSKFIPMLLGIVYYCLIKEEITEMIQKFKNPTIDFRKLNNLTIQKIKQLRPEIF